MKKIENKFTSELLPVSQVKITKVCFCSKSTGNPAGKYLLKVSNAQFCTI